MNEAIQRRAHKIAILLFVSTAVALPAAARAEASAAEGLDSRINFVGKLINESSASRKVHDSGNALAKALRDEASALYVQALASRDDGDAATASEQLSDAIRKMYEAVDAASGGGASTMAKGSRDYENRRASVEALLDAHARIAEEKGLGSAHARLAVDVRREVAEADATLAAGDLTVARDRLDHAYESVRHAVEGLREGETLVRELNFESTKDEYEYELDRNDTHRMLIDMLITEEKTGAGARARAEELIGSASTLRQEAEENAGSGRYEKAIELLERSTGELVKAIRGAGVYIPG